MQRKVADVVEQKAKLAISVIASAKISKFQPLSMIHTSWRHQNMNCERTDFMTNVLCYNIVELIISVHRSPKVLLTPQQTSLRSTNKPYIIGVRIV